MINNKTINKESLKFFFKNKRVVITGHTGFKGSWLSFILHLMGSKVLGLSLKPENKRGNFEMKNKIAEFL